MPGVGPNLTCGQIVPGMALRDSNGVTSCGVDLPRVWHSELRPKQVGVVDFYDRGEPHGHHCPMGDNDELIPTSELVNSRLETPDRRPDGLPSLEVRPSQVQTSRVA